MGAPTTLEAIVSVAMPNCSPKIRDAPIDAEHDESEHVLEFDDLPADRQENDHAYVAQLERKWRSTLVAAAFYTDTNCLVIPDAGCGVYGNPPELVGAAFGRVLGQEFPNGFEQVIIAAYGAVASEFEKAAQEAFAGA